MRTLVLIAALLWASTSGWWYVCNIKGHCKADLEVTLAESTDAEKDRNKETNPNDEPEKSTESLDTNENTSENETIEPEVSSADNEESSSSIASQMTEEELAKATKNLDEAIKADNAEAAQSEETATNDTVNNTDNSNTDPDGLDSNNEVVVTNNADNSTTDGLDANSEIGNSIEDIAILENINLKDDKDLSKIKIDRAKKSSSDVDQDSTIKIKKVRIYLPRTVSKQTASNTNAEFYLDKVIEMLNADDSLKISLIGYTDSTGGNARNKAIGLRRAKILKSILVNKGAPAARIIADSKGEEDPIWSNKSKAGREKNRRVELTQFIEVENKEQE
jgi:outer membrane protein OmpA-like peptidoglycan-associated protein